MPYTIDFDAGVYRPAKEHTGDFQQPDGTWTRRVEFIYFRTANGYHDSECKEIARLACGDSYRMPAQVITRVPSDTMLAVQLRAQFSLIGLTYVMRAQDPNSIDAASIGPPSLEDLIDTVEANKHLASYFGELVGI